MEINRGLSINLYFRNIENYMGTLHMKNYAYLWAHLLTYRVIR